jgi:hypothetical protein
MRWIRRLRSEEPLQKRVCEAPDCAAYGTRGGTLSCLTKDSTSGTTRGRAYNTTRRRPGGQILFRTFPTFGYCRVCPCYTLVDIPVSDTMSHSH